MTKINLPSMFFCSFIWVYKVNLGRLTDCSEYFRALSQSSMRETTESLIVLDHIPSSVFHSLLEFCFRNDFSVPQEELGEHIQVGGRLIPHISYLFSTHMEMNLSQAGTSHREPAIYCFKSHMYDNSLSLSDSGGGQLPAG